jgi:uncharacterized protein (TIGR02466 family)
MLVIDSLFPIFVGKEKNVFTEEEQKIINNRVNYISENNSMSHNLWLAKDQSPKNSFLSYNIVNDKEMKFFILKITEKVHEFASYYNDKRIYGCNESWINIYSKNNYQEPHYHPMCTYSVVYFSEVPENSGKIVFQNPSINELGFPVTFENLGSEKIYTPEKNMILIFRSNLAHYVLPGTNNDSRVSIASNFMIVPELYDKIYKKTLRKDNK